MLFQIIGEYLLYGNSAKEIEILLKHTEENKKLIDSIGGYRSYEINYDQSSRDRKEIYKFDLYVFGKSAYINYIGKAGYNQENKIWEIIEIDTLIKRY